MGLPRRDDPRIIGSERRLPGDRATPAEPQLSDAELAAIRTLLDEADRPSWHRSLARMPRATLAAGLAVWGFALYGLWRLVA